MSYMFHEAEAFNQPLEWDVASATSFDQMFVSTALARATLVTDVGRPPVLVVEPESDPPSPPPPPAPTDPPAEEPANTMLVSILAIAITTLVIILAMGVVLIVGVCQPSFLEKAMALLQRSKSKHADVNVNRV
jgi:hypothetical protein